MALFLLALFVALIVVMFIIILFYGTRETSFEQALEEQRNKNDFDLLSSTSTKQENKKEHKKDKSKKSKENPIKKSKNKIVNNLNSKSSVSKSQNVSDVSSKTSKTTVKDEPDSSMKDLHSSNKTQSDSPIITATIPATIPKQSKPSETQTINPVKETIQKKSAVVPSDGDKIVPVKESKAVANAVKEEPKVVKKNKKPVSKDFKVLELKNVMSFIKLSLLTEEDVTILTDALLNRQADDQLNGSSWHKKNDPLEALKKQISERDEQMAAQKMNLETAKRKSEELQADLNNYRKRFSLSQNENSKLKEEIEKLQGNFSLVAKDLEMKNQQQLNKIRQEEQTRLFKSQQEVSRLTEMINCLNENLKEKENVIQDFSDKNQTLEKKIIELGEMNNNYLTNINTREDALKKNTDYLQGEIVKLQNDKNMLDSSLKQSVEKYKNDVEKLNINLEEIKSVKEELSRSCATLEKEKLSLVKEKENYVQESKKLKDDFENVKKSYSALENEKNSLLIEKKNSMVEINELKAQIEQTKFENKTNGDIEHEKSSLIKENENLMIEVNKLRTTLQQNEIENKNLLSKLDALSKEKDILALNFKQINEHNEKLKELLSAFQILGLETDNKEKLMKQINEIQSDLSDYKLSKGSNDLYKQAVDENANLKERIEELTQKSEMYALTLVDTEKILFEIQDKITKQKGEFEQKLGEKDVQIETINKELNIFQDKAGSLQELNDQLLKKLGKLNENVSARDSELSTLKNQVQILSTELDQHKEENKSLIARNAKLNDLVQIGKNSYQEESKKVQDLESKISLLNGKENSTMPTTNGN